MLVPTARSNEATHAWYYNYCTVKSPIFFFEQLGALRINCMQYALLTYGNMPV